MKHVHEMKERLALELEQACEKIVGEEMDLVELKLIKMMASTYNELHEACHIMHKHAEHELPYMAMHYKKT